jgi:hypothetical protein
MAVWYGNNCMGQRKVYEGVVRFKGRQTGVVDDMCSGPSSTATSSDEISFEKSISHRMKR